MSENKRAVQTNAEDDSAAVEEKVDRMLGESRIRRSLTVEQIKGIDFWQIYGVCVALILIVMGAAFGYLWQNLVLYERSSPEKILARYLQPLVSGGLPRLMVTEASIPAKYESITERDSYIREVLASGELSYLREADESGGGRDVFIYMAGDTIIAAVTLEKRQTGRFGFWDPVKVDIRMPIYGDLKVIAPRDCFVSANGIGLYSEDITGDDIPYQDLAGSLEDKAESVSRRTYLLSGLYRKPEISAAGADGAPLSAVLKEDANGPLALVIPSLPEAPSEAEEPDAPEAPIENGQSK